MSEIQAIKKITPRTIGLSTGGIKDLLYGEGKGNGSEAHLYSVVGVVSAIRAGQSDFGPWTKLIGEFVAKNRDGKLYSAAQCFLPNFLTDQAVGAFKAGDGHPVEFAFDVGAKRDDSAAVGYEYTAKAKIDIQKSTRMLQLLEKSGMSAEVRQLEPPAPKALSGTHETPKVARK